MPGTKFKQLKDKNPNTEIYLSKVAKVESGNNPNAQNPYGSATGLFQFTESTWNGLNQKYGLGYTLEDRKNPEKAANVMRLFTQENENSLKPVLGRSLTDGEKYMAHFLGAGGAKKFFTVYNANPNAPISTVLSSDALKANKSVVYNKDGSLKTVADIQGWANNKMNVKTEPKIYTPTTEEKTVAYQPTKIFIPGQTASLQTSTTDYNEPEEPKNTQEVAQAKQEISEKSFLQDLGSVFNQPIAQQEQPIQEEIPNNDEAYNYIDIEEYQKGGSVDSSKERSYYDPRTQKIHYAKDYIKGSPELKKDIEEHENYHNWQQNNDRTNFNIVHNSDSAFNEKLKKSPQFPTTDEVWDSYHNRQQEEVQVELKDLKQSDPQLQFIPNQVLYDKILDYKMYDNPYSYEGEADTRKPFKDGGRLKRKIK